MSERVNLYSMWKVRTGGDALIVNYLLWLADRWSVYLTDVLETEEEMTDGGKIISFENWLIAMPTEGVRECN